MTRNPSRISLYHFLSSNVIINAQTTTKIIPPPQSSVPVMNVVAFFAADNHASHGPQSLVARASPSINQNTSSPSPTAANTSNASSMSTGVTATNPDSDESIMRSSVPMVAGSLAGFIAILAAILTVVVIRRKRRRPMSRAMDIPPPFIGGNRTAAEHLSPTPPRSTVMENPFIAPISARPTSKKRASRYEYVTEDVELTQDGLTPRFAYNGSTEEVIANNGDRQHSGTLQQQSRLMTASDGYSLNIPSSIPTSTLQTGIPEKTIPPRSNSNSVSEPTLASPALVAGSGLASLTSASHGHRTTLDRNILNVPPPLSPTWIPTRGVDRGGDLPPAYEDVR